MNAVAKERPFGVVAATPGEGEAKPKPPQVAQYNWIAERWEAEPEQLELALPEAPVVEPEFEQQVMLLATESGTQLLVAGYGLSLGKTSERLTVKKARKVVAQLPFLKLQEVVVASRGVSVSSDLMEECCKRGIRLAFPGQSGKPFALLTSPLLTATVETRKAQVRADSTPDGVEIMRWMVAGKVRNQAKLLNYFARNRQTDAGANLRLAMKALHRIREQILALEGATCAEIRPSILGYEGAAARVYWLSLVELTPEGHQFAGRNAYSPSDAVNAALNYGYGILTSHVWGAVMNAGLEPFAGLLHTDRSGKPSLVLDLLEEFRQPIVDRPVFSWIFKGGSPRLQGGMLDSESRESVAGRVLARLNAVEPHRGKNHQVRSIIQMQARLAASAFRGLKRYRPFTFQW